MAARDFGRDGRSKREMEVTEAREIETAVVCVCDALRPRTGKASFMGITGSCRDMYSQGLVGYSRFPPHSSVHRMAWVALRVMALNVVTGEVQGSDHRYTGASGHKAVRFL